MRTPGNLLAPLALTLCPLASAQTFVETFDGGSNAGGWTFGNPADQIELAGGNPGAFLHNANLDTFAPQPRTTLLGSPFTGDWRARGVSSFGIDLRTLSTQFPYQREATLVLTDGSGCSVYWLGTDFVPQPAEGWKSFEFAIDAASPTLPPGWTTLGSCASGDVAWNAVIQDVQQVGLFYGDPTFFFIFDIWDVGLDNPRLSEGVGSAYCSASPNSSGSAAAMSASGSASIAAQDLVLSATSLPAQQNGLFYYGAGQTQVPFGNGLRCVAPGASGLARLPISSSGVAGTLSHALDYASPPTAATQISAGSSWNFQAWFRDPAAGGAFFDLSNGLAIQFLP